MTSPIGTYDTNPDPPVVSNSKGLQLLWFPILGGTVLGSSSHQSLVVSRMVKIIIINKTKMEEVTKIVYFKDLISFHMKHNISFT